MLERGERVFHLLAAGLIAILLMTIGGLPPVVASHFDAAGRPNGWSTRPVYVLVLLVIGVLLPLSIAWVIRGLTRQGVANLNIPARDHWVRPEHGPEAVRRVRAYIWWLGCIMAAMALLIHLLIVAAHAHDPPRLSSVGILLVLGGVVLGILGWAVGWYRLLARPRGGPR